MQYTIIKKKSKERSYVYTEEQREQRKIQRGNVSRRVTEKSQINAREFNYKNTTKEIAASLRSSQ